MEEYWKKLEKDLRGDFSSRDLDTPEIRKGTLKNLIKYCKGRIRNSSALSVTINRGKNTFKTEYAKSKKTKECNGAEESVINDMFKYFVENKDQIGVEESKNDEKNSNVGN